MSLSWSVPDLLKHKDEGISFHEKVELPLELFHADPEVRGLSACEVDGLVEFVRHSLTFHLHIKGTMILPCALTLKDVAYPFAIDTSERFLLSGSVPEGESDAWVHPVENDRIDLIPCLVEAILVEKPMRVVSDEAKSSRNLSGKGWSLINEQGTEQQMDPRLEKLKKFFDD